MARRIRCGGPTLISCERERSIAFRFDDDLLAAVAPQVWGRDVTVREVLDKASEAIEGKFENEPLIAVTVQRARRSRAGWPLAYQRVPEKTRRVFDGA